MELVPLKLCGAPVGAAPSFLKTKQNKSNYDDKETEESTVMYQSYKSWFGDLCSLRHHHRLTEIILLCHRAQNIS